MVLHTKQTKTEGVKVNAAPNMMAVAGARGLHAALPLQVRGDRAPLGIRGPGPLSGV
jgi:hypothetical protein